MAASNTESNARHDTRRLWAGVGAGLIAGIAMGLFLVINANAIGAGAWLPFRLIAATMVDVKALLGGPATIVLGVLLHLFLSALFGGLFVGLLGHRRSGAATLVYGWAYALAILLVMTFVALPRMDPVMSARVRMIPVAWLLAHLVYGTTLALTPLLYGLFHRRRIPVLAQQPA